MIRPEKIVLHLSFPHPVYGTFTPIKLEDHQFIDTQEEKEEALNIAKKRLEDWYWKNYPRLDLGIPPCEPSQASNPKVISKDVERIEIAIDNAQTLEELYPLRKDADKWNILPQYIKKFNELNNGRPTDFAAGLE